MRMGLALLGYVFALRRPTVDGLRARRAVVVCALALTVFLLKYTATTERLSDGPVAGSKRQAAKKAVPLPSQALLAPQVTPDCEGKGQGQQLASTDASAVVAPRPETNADLALRIKLEYEREC